MVSCALVVIEEGGVSSERGGEEGGKEKEKRREGKMEKV